MYRAYQFLFFKIYYWNRRWIKKSEQPIFNSFLAINLLSLINIISFSLIIELTLHFKVIDFENYQFSYWIAIIIVVILVNYFILLHNDKYKKNLNYFENKETSLKNEVSAITFISFSIILFTSGILYLIYLK